MPSSQSKVRPKHLHNIHLMSYTMRRRRHPGMYQTNACIGSHSDGPDFKVIVQTLNIPLTNNQEVCSE